MQQACGLCPVRAAMFDGLSTSLEKAWDIVRKDGKLTAENIKAPMREIRRALLEADVCPLLLSHPEFWSRKFKPPDAFAWIHCYRRCCSFPCRFAC